MYHNPRQDQFNYYNPQGYGPPRDGRYGGYGGDYNPEYMDYGPPRHYNPQPYRGERDDRDTRYGGPPRYADDGPEFDSRRGAPRGGHPPMRGGDRIPERGGHQPMRDGERGGMEYAGRGRGGPPRDHRRYDDSGSEGSDF